MGTLTRLHVFDIYQPPRRGLARDRPGGDLTPLLLNVHHIFPPADANRSHLQHPDCRLMATLPNRHQNR